MGLPRDDSERLRTSRARDDGYVLMTVTVINWAVASHDLEAVGRLTGDVGLVGPEAFGKPLLSTIFVVTLVGAFRGIRVAALAEPTDDPGPDPEPAATDRLRSSTVS